MTAVIALPIPIPRAPDPILANAPALPATCAEALLRNTSNIRTEKGALFISLQYQYLAKPRVTIIDFHPVEIDAVCDNLALIITAVPEFVEFRSAPWRVPNQRSDTVHAKVEYFNSDELGWCNRLA